MASSLIRNVFKINKYRPIKNIILSQTQLISYPTIKLLGNHRFISTSKNKPDSVTVQQESLTQSENNIDLEDRDENWMSFGYNFVDRTEDEFSHHIVLFTAMLTMSMMAFFFGYFPDFKNVAWSQREAYLQMAKREKEGLPYIDANLIDISKIELPSDEELGDTDIII